MSNLCFAGPDATAVVAMASHNEVILKDNLRGGGLSVWRWISDMALAYGWNLEVGKNLVWEKGKIVMYEEIVMYEAKAEAEADR